MALQNQQLTHDPYADAKWRRYYYRSRKLQRAVQAAYAAAIKAFPKYYNDDCFERIAKQEFRKYVNPTLLGETYGPELLEFAYNDLLMQIKDKVAASLHYILDEYRPRPNKVRSQLRKRPKRWVTVTSGGLPGSGKRK